jgi:hypothetical protein
VLTCGAGHAASITGWNTGNVAIGDNPPVVGDTGFSVVYDRAFPDADAVTNGRIAFTPPEAVSPGIKVQPESYSRGVDLTGCLMTSNPDAVCTSPFQSGKRIKQQMTGVGPVDLVFDIANDGTESTYQVFHRLINLTGQDLDGFKIELGFGIGSDFTAANSSDNLIFSTGFSAMPSGSGPASTQYPFGLFGDAADNPNFSLNGFFEPERTGFVDIFDDAISPTVLSSDGYFGPYPEYFGNWLSQEAVPLGAFWDQDNDPSTDALLMAWFTDGIWQARRDADGTDAVSIAPVDFATYAELEEFLGLGDLLFQGAIEDLANLNVNFAIQLGDLGDRTSFTMRTTVSPAPIPLPAGAPLLIGAVAALAALRRRQNRGT